jgi:type II secretory pathway predicted ATPase ExeA
MHLFLEEAVREIYQYTRGYPRQVTMLCYKALKALVMRKKIIVDAELIEEIIQEEARAGWQRKDLLLQRENY